MISPATILPNVCFFNGLWFCNLNGLIPLITRWASDRKVLIKNIFSSKHKNFGITGKLIWFRSVILVVNSDITRTYRVSKVVKIGVKIVKLKLLGSLQWVIKDGFFLGFWKRFFHKIIFFNSLSFFNPKIF